MSRVSIYLVLFLISFNAGAVMLSTTGVDDAVGIGAQGVDSGETQHIEEAANETSVGTGTGPFTGVEMYAVLGKTLAAILAIQPAMDMLLQVGVPLYLIGFANAIIAIIVGIDIISFIRGFNL
jgi:hypothetical protein